MKKIINYINYYMFADGLSNIIISISLFIIYYYFFDNIIIAIIACIFAISYIVIIAIDNFCRKFYLGRVVGKKLNKIKSCNTKYYKYNKNKINYRFNTSFFEKVFRRIDQCQNKSLYVAIGFLLVYYFILDSMLIVMIGSIFLLSYIINQTIERLCTMIKENMK